MAIDAPPAERRSRSSGARCPTSRASTCSATPRPRDLRRQGEVDPQAGRQHFSNPTPYGTTALTDEIDHIEYARRRTPRPRRCSPSRTSSSSTSRASTSGCATTSRTPTSRSASTRTSRASTSRASATAASAPTSARTRRPSACAARSTCSARSSCSAPARAPSPGRHSGSPCLDYYIKRCGAPCVGYVSKEEYREGIDGVIAFLSGRFKQIERDLEQRMYFAAGEQDYEQADDRAQPPAGGARAARAPARRRRAAPAPTTRSPSRSRAPRPTRRSSRSATACSPTASRFYLDNEAEQDAARVVAEEFMLQYYASALSIPALIVVQGELADGSELERARARCWPSAAAARSRSAPPSAAASAASSTSPSATRGSRSTRRSSRPSAAASSAWSRSTGLQARARARRAAGADRVLRHLAPRRHAHRRVDGRVRGRRAEEVRLPALHDPRGRPAATISPRWRRSCRAATRSWRSRPSSSPYDAERDASFAALPEPGVIDGGKGQLAAGLEPLQGFRERGVAVVSLAKRIEEVFLPGSPEPVRAAARHAGAAAAAARARRGAPLRHHPPPDPPRQGDDRVDHGRAAGHRPGAQARAAQALRLARGRARPPSREELENVPGFPQKVARDLYAHLNKTGR